jgi:hypothetical protein
MHTVQHLYLQCTVQYCTVLYIIHTGAGTAYDIYININTCNGLVLYYNGVIMAL